MDSSSTDDFSKILEYRIYKCSSYSSTYVPENILVDEPTDQSSRWSSDNDNPPQYLILKLQYPSVVQTVTFGKYEKTHVCNIKKFKVYGGMKPDNMMELLESGLKNDAIPETFDLKYTIGNEGNYFPVRFIKILPLQPWGASFNFSIWHVKLSGFDNPKIIQSSIEWVNSYRRKEVIRLCMKHFRRYEQEEIVNTLERVTGIPLEDPRMSNLYDLLVKKGDHNQAEKFITSIATVGLLKDYISAQSYRAKWTKLNLSDPKPGMRGGHQMVLDSAAEMLYMFGGWDGNQDLADLWSFNMSTNKWTLICKNTEAVGGPSARSCHKMCLDPTRRQIFTLGRYLDTQYRCPENLKSDFHVYDIETDKWTQISEDTGAVGGPELVFDHQMSMDPEKRTIYVFGGRVLVEPPNSEEHGIMPGPLEPIFSGLYSFHVPTGTWTKLACDVSRSNIANLPVVRSRVGHSMLFHPGTRKLYIFAGKRNKEYLNDFFTYEVDTHLVDHICINDLGNRDASQISQDAGFTHRATIDPDLDEIYVLSGMSKDKDKRDEHVQNSLWVYNIKTNKRSCIYQNESIREKYWAKTNDHEPCPRFAHQLVYDNVNKIHYLFGGNPGHYYQPKLRLDDFWQLKLSRPSHEQILQKCKFLIRKHKFEELALENSVEALEYLQTKIAEIIDHNDEEQTKEFQSLASLLFCHKDLSTGMETIESCPDSSTSSKSSAPNRDIHVRRSELYDQLSEFFPESLTQPRANLIDLLPF